MCVSPPVERAAAVELRVSLNSQIYSNDSLIYRYGFTGFAHKSRSGKRSLLQDYEVALSEANKVGATLSLSGVPTEAIAIDPRLTGGVHPHSEPGAARSFSTPDTNFDNNQRLNAVFDYLPFAPDNCIFFEAGDYTSLQSLETDAGDLIPPFQPEVYEYYTLISVDQVCACDCPRWLATLCSQTANW